MIVNNGLFSICHHFLITIKANFVSFRAINDNLSSRNKKKTQLFSSIVFVEIELFVDAVSGHIAAKLCSIQYIYSIFGVYESKIV